MNEDLLNRPKPGDRDFDEEEFPLSAEPVAPGAIVDAGLDQREPYSVRQGLRLLKRATRAYGVSLRLADLEQERAHRLIRGSLEMAASATYWLDGSPHLTDAHFQIHQIGRSARELFPEGCHLFWTGSSYEHRCPVPIAHKRFGNSATLIVARRRCSLCGEDVSECPHLPHHMYRARGGPASSPWGRCPLCHEEACKHDPSKTFLVRPVAIVEEVVRVEEISLVSRPKQPDARFTALPVETEAVAAALGSDFNVGMQVSCSQCLQPCGGFTYLTFT
jgi:hypothetical protein